LFDFPFFCAETYPPVFVKGHNEEFYASRKPGFVGSGTYTEIGKSPISCTLERVLQENPFSSADELGYKVTFSDGSMVTHFDSSTMNSVPLNHECYLLDVSPDIRPLTQSPRGIVGSANDNDDRLLALISDNFCVQVLPKTFASSSFLEIFRCAGTIDGRFRTSIACSEGI
jgi:hypothetical protein